MKDIKQYIAASAIAAFMLTGCGKEAPFNGEPDDEGNGRFLKEAISVSIRYGEVAVRSAYEIPLGDFDIAITKEGETEPTKSYKYKDMPEVVVLSPGQYSITATYGDGRQSGINTPYYVGQSAPFTINANAITDNISDVECVLSNVKVTVEFDSMLTEQMSEDTKVTISYGNSNPVTLNKQNERNGDAAYFPFVPDENMAFNIVGTIEGWDTNETKYLDQITNSTHYKVTLKLRSLDGTNSGQINTNGLRINATVNSIDLVRNVPAAEDKILEDDERPKDGPTGGNENPNPPTGDGPTITAEGSLDLNGINIMKGDGTDVVVLNVHSETGFTTFTADIISDTLTPEELASVGLASHLDLINPGDLAEVLDGLGLPTYVEGKKDVRFDISTFMGLLGALGSGEHTFAITVADASGTTTANLKLKFN